MKLTHSLVAIAALCGSSIAFAGNGNAVDPTANTAVQINVAIQFGPTSAIRTHACFNPTVYNGVNTCPSVTTTNLTPGYRLVITNISGSLTYSPNGGGEVMSETISFGVNVGNNIFFSQLPMEHAQVVGGTTYYSFNKAVHMFADPGVGFPEVLVSNFQSVGPFFRFGTGYLNMTIQGYQVPLN
jgi:hypothetical protein